MDSLFLTSVQLSMEEWPALQIAIEQGMGGDLAREKEKWMADVIVELFDTNRGNVDPSDVVDYVGQILEAEFDTVIDDGSLDMFSYRLCHFHKLQSSGKEADLVVIVDRKRAELSAKAVVKARESENIANEMRRLACDESNEALSSEPNEQAMDTTDSEMPVEDDGWTVVGNKKPSKRK